MKQGCERPKIAANTRAAMIVAGEALPIFYVSGCRSISPRKSAAEYACSGAAFPAQGRQVVPQEARANFERSRFRSQKAPDLKLPELKLRNIAVTVFRLLEKPPKTRSVSPEPETGRMATLEAMQKLSKIDPQ